MRSFARFGVALAATAMASTAALTGATAGAEEPAPAKPVFNSPSSVSVSGKGATTKVTYTNKSAHDLMCSGFAGQDRLIGDLYTYIKRSGNSGDEGVPAALNARLMAALVEGKMGAYMGGVEKGKSADLGPISGLPGMEVPPGSAGLTDGSFAPAALVICMNPEGGTYIEVEVSAGVGVPAGLGSLDSALAGIGSSGSVAETTGSLGS